MGLTASCNRYRCKYFPFLFYSRPVVRVSMVDADQQHEKNLKRMALLDEFLVVKKSIIPGAGKGLFTKVGIQKGTRITEYKGEIKTWKQVEAEVDDHIGYAFWFSNQHVIDAWQTKEGVAHYANDAKGLVKVPGAVNNSEYVTEKGRCYISATRNIPAGSEIFVDYGREYWSVIRYNNRLAAKSAKTAKGSKKVVGNR
jgi:uncharacterized protein